MEEEDLEVYIPEITTISLPRTYLTEQYTPDPSDRKDAPADRCHSSLNEMKKHNRQKESEFTELLSQIKGLKHLQVKKMNEVVLIQKKLSIVEDNRNRKKYIKVIT